MGVDERTTSGVERRLGPSEGLSHGEETRGGLGSKVKTDMFGVWVCSAGGVIDRGWCHLG